MPRVLLFRAVSFGAIIKVDMRKRKTPSTSEGNALLVKLMDALKDNTTLIILLNTILIMRSPNGHGQNIEMSAVLQFLL